MEGKEKLHVVSIQVVI